MNRRSDIDVLKGIAIIAIVFYHIGILPYGYLGVDVFFVIAGFLTCRKRLNTGHWFTLKEVIKWFMARIIRLTPIVLAACILGLIIGYFVMLPDDYEKLAEGVVASDLYANNILAILTTKNYWDVVNDYKPLMQTWYLGVLMQIYAIVAVVGLIQALYIRHSKHHGKGFRLAAVLSAFLGLISLLLYLFDDTAYTIKYYLPQYRFWEFALGGLLGIYSEQTDFSLPLSVGQSKVVRYVVYLLLLFILCFGFKSISECNSSYGIVIGMKDIESGISSMRIARCIIVASLSGLLLIIPGKEWKSNPIATIGKMSLSIFIWHQFILAFMRYTVMESLSVSWLLLILTMIGVTSVVSYKSLEKTHRWSPIVVASILACWILTTSTGFVIYERRGVVRDVPEMGILRNGPSTLRYSEYVDRFYNYRMPFTTNKQHVLVIGNSYARDFANILDEYDREGNLEIAYSEYQRLTKEDLCSIDYIFVFGNKQILLDLLPDSVDCQLPVYGISTKYYGNNLGLAYSHRGEESYYQQSVPRNELCDSINESWKKSYDENHFVDLMEVIRKKDGSIPLFTPDSMIISFDCRHLTQGGCRYYAKILGLDKIFHGEAEKVVENR